MRLTSQIRMKGVLYFRVYAPLQSEGCYILGLTPHESLERVLRSKVHAALGSEGRPRLEGSRPSKVSGWAWTPRLTP